MPKTFKQEMAIADPKGTRKYDQPSVIQRGNLSFHDPVRPVVRYRPTISRTDECESATPFGSV